MGDVKANQEGTFEASIVEYLASNGWIEGDPKEYSRPLGLNPEELVRFVESSQPDEWAKLVGLHGGRAAVIVPDGVLFGSSNAHKALRKALVEEQKLDGVVSPSTRPGRPVLVGSP